MNFRRLKIRIVIVLLVLSLGHLCWILKYPKSSFDPEEVIKWNDSAPSSSIYILNDSTDKTGEEAVDASFILSSKYMFEGVPLDMFRFYRPWLTTDSYLEVAPNDDFQLNKDSIPWGLSVNVSNDVEVVNANCFKCHSSRINGQLILGIGNVYSNYQQSKRLEALFLTFYKHLFASEKNRIALGNFNLHYEEIAKYSVTNNPIVIPAFRIEEACMQYLSPHDVRYQTERNFLIDENTIASDTPPLWNVRHKDALYYNGMGRGAFEKLILQITVLGNADSSALRQSLPVARAILSWANQLEPPPFPGSIDSAIAKKGEKVYRSMCASCHGAPSERSDWVYETKLFSSSIVGTDPFYAIYLRNKSGISDWYNKSWFSLSKPTSKLTPIEAYVAPPLRGIWATAPYLHNGSIPNLRGVIDSDSRPKRWKIDINEKINYDLENVGLRFEVVANKNSEFVYDTTIPGYWNTGHTYSDQLKEFELTELLEYLKTL
jgi:hypothetical protein